MSLPNHDTTLSGLASGLQKVRWHGDYKFIACCPAHDDKHPSLSVTDSNGKILLKCFSGCSQEQVIGALRDLGLWHAASRDKIDLRRRSELKEATRHHQQILALGVNQVGALSELDRAQVKKSIQFLQEHGHG